MVFFFGVAGLFGFPLLLENITGKNDVLNVYPWCEFIGMFTAGVSCLFLGKLLNRVRSTGTMDRETGEEIFTKGNHAFFYIKMEYWFFIQRVT